MTAGATSQDWARFTALGLTADLLPVVSEFASRGFTVMTFDYRDFGPAGPGEADSLVQLAFASRWVNDAEGALRYARSRAGKRPSAASIAAWALFSTASSAD